MSTSLRLRTLIAVAFLAANLSAGELLIDFVPKATGDFYTDSPELKITVSFDKEGEPSLSSSESTVPIGVFGHCPEMAGRALHLSLKAIGLVDPVTGLDAGESFATDINILSPTGLGVISPTDTKNYHRRAIANTAGRSEGVLFEFDLASVPRTIRLTVTEISLATFNDANDALTLKKIGGLTYDYIPSSDEGLQPIDVRNAELTLRGDPRPIALFSICASGAGSSYRLANFRIEFEKIAPGE